MPPLWFMPVVFRMSSCLLRANYFIVHERWKPAWDIDGLWCKESRNFIKISISCLLPVEETFLSHISVAQSREQWQTRLKHQCPGCMGSPQDPDMKSLWNPHITDGSFPSLMCFQSAGEGQVSSAVCAPGQFSWEIQEQYLEGFLLNILIIFPKHSYW